MLKSINTYLKKHIANSTWYINTWYIGCYMYTGLGKWTGNAFITHSAIVLSFLILAYSIYIAILIHQSAEGSIRRKAMPKAYIGIFLGILLVIYTLFFL